jgi:hypothetical protein
LGATDGAATQQEIMSDLKTNQEEIANLINGTYFPNPITDGLFIKKTILLHFINMKGMFSTIEGVLDAASLPKPDAIRGIEKLKQSKHIVEEVNIIGTKMWKLNLEAENTDT